MNQKDIEDFYPLSPMQQGMFFHSLLSPDSGIYIEQVSCTLKGDFDIDAFKLAWQQVVDYIAVFRSSFISKGLNEPLQVINRKAAISFEIFDWQSLTTFDLEDTFNITRSSEQKKGFDISKAPLMRFMLSKISADSYFFLWTYHHILLDGWSMPLVFREVMQRYDSLICGKYYSPGESRNYRDYIKWLKNQNPMDAENYWRSKLKDLDSPTIIFKGNNKNESGVDYAEQTISLNEDFTEQLRSFAGKAKLTINTLVQGAWALLLGSYSGQKDIIFGTTVSGRPVDLPGAESIIGLLINTLPVRVKLSKEVKLILWLNELQKQLLEMRQYEYSSLIDIQKLTDIPKSLPLFENILVFENYPAEALKSTGIKNIEVDNIVFAEKVNYPLTLVVGLSEMLQFRLIYDLSCLDNKIAANMLENLVTIIRSFIKPGTITLSDVQLLSKSESSSILKNTKKRNYNNHHHCIHELFELQVNKTPDNIAVVSQDQFLTYRELDEKANQLANYLISMGISSETLIGVLVDRSIEMIVSIMGVLKSGAAYIPIDPNIPAERLDYILNDAELKTFITQSFYGDKFKDGLNLIFIDSEWEEIEKEKKEKPYIICTPENLSYVIYTSGSTGKPKGVLITHLGASNFIKGLSDIVQINSDEKWLQFFSLSFDGSVGDIFPVLANGAALYIPEKMTLLDPRNLENYIRNNLITTIFMTPSVLAMIDINRLYCLEKIISGGETLNRELAYKLFGGRRLFNAYGPTETSVAAAMFELNDLDDNSNANIPIGISLLNTHLFVLDSDLNLVPIGGTGELYIGGCGVARGYLNKADLTAEKFIPDPFSDSPGERIYSTGDIVRLLYDGNLEYIERADNQVKVRGFRIELGEIESAIRQCQGVLDAALDIKGDSADDKKIFAYIIPEYESSVDIDELKGEISKILPVYMLPSAYVLLKEFPLNSSGKLDKKALPLPEENSPGRSLQFFAPRNSWELNLTRIWEEILNRHPISVTDNFFDLGGHSLLAIRLMDMIQEKLNVSIPLVSIYQNPTIESLAPILKDSTSEEGTSLLVELKKGESQEPLFFIHPSGGSVHWYTELAKFIEPATPFYAIQAAGIDGREKLDDSIEIMASRYTDLILKKQSSGPFNIGGWSFGVIVAFEVACQLMALGHEVKLLALLDCEPVLKSAEPEDTAELLIDIFSKVIQIDVNYLRTLEYEEQFAFVFKLAKKAKLIPFYAKLSQFSFYITILKTMQHAWRKYCLKTFPGKITLFRSEESKANLSLPLDMGWNNYASKGVQVIDVPGDHISMMDKPNVKYLAEELNGLLKVN